MLRAAPAQHEPQLHLQLTALLRNQMHDFALQCLGNDNPFSANALWIAGDLPVELLHLLVALALSIRVSASGTHLVSSPRACSLPSRRTGRQSQQRAFEERREADSMSSTGPLSCCNIARELRLAAGPHLCLTHRKTACYT